MLSLGAMLLSWCFTGTGTRYRCCCWSGNIIDLGRSPAVRRFTFGKPVLSAGSRDGRALSAVLSASV